MPLVHDEDSDPYKMIEWDTWHDWRMSNFHFNDASATVEDLEGHLQAQLNNDQPFERPAIVFDDLNEQQQLAFSMAV